MAWKDTERERWSPELACCVRRITYDFERREGRLDMPPVTCCDMEGCINLFRAIDPGVRIETYAGGQRDTFYWRDDRDRWCSIDHCGRHFGWAPIRLRQ